MLACNALAIVCALIGSCMADSVCNSDIKRSVAPAARIISPQTSAIVPTAPATIMAYNTNEASSPPVMVPALTCLAPIHSTKIMVPNTAETIIKVINARTLMRFFAVLKLILVLCVKREISFCSCV